VGTYRVTMLPMGIGDVPGPELFWMSDWDQWHPLLFQVALIQGGDVTALVNTGPARDITAMNAKWSAMLGDRAALRRDDGQFILDQLAARGIGPDDITHVILTPLQLYTVSNVAAFGRARICLSRRGWTHFHTTHSHPHDDRATSIPDDVLVHLVTDAWPRVRLLDDEDELAPGLRTWWSGVHHRASIVIEVDTAVGTAAISDSYFYLENVERGHPIGINENMYEAISVYARAAADGKIVVPLYDPKNLTRFPGGQLG
jgi:glyoxylase-like metal-dependent hydrolase (beta-lactamase superfamily II)